MKNRHRFLYSTNGDTMYALCDGCGASARISMEKVMTERQGLAFDTAKARKLLGRHLMALQCSNVKMVSTFPLIR
jgi:hypothetical protein